MAAPVVLTLPRILLPMARHWLGVWSREYGHPVIVTRARPPLWRSVSPDSLPLANLRRMSWERRILPLLGRSTLTARGVGALSLPANIRTVFTNDADYLSPGVYLPQVSLRPIAHRRAYRTVGNVPAPYALSVTNPNVRRSEANTRRKDDKASSGARRLYLGGNWPAKDSARFNYMQHAFASSAGDPARFFTSLALYDGLAEHDRIPRLLADWQWEFPISTYTGKW